VSAVSEDFMRERRNASGRESPETSRPDEKPVAAFWQWIALGVLILCWVAEASLR
jgi:hypothetical protein